MCYVDAVNAMLLSRTGRAEDRLLELADLSSPRPGPGQVTIDVEACGVCRTDLHIVEGEVPAALPIVPGHQAAGRIAEHGEGVDAFAVGDAVGVGWLFSTCGTCAFCRDGRENLCRDARFTGRDVHGGYAQRMVADAGYVYHLPPSFAPIDAAPLLCAGIIGYRSLKLSAIEPGGRLGLVGFGASAHLTIQVARHMGCDVYVFTREEHHRELALELGAVWAGEAWEDPGVQLNAAVIFAPAGELVPQALARLDRGGTLAINAIHMTDIPRIAYDALYHERTIRSVANFTRRDAEEFLALAAEIPIRAAIERFRLEDANEALLRVKRGAVHGAAVLEIA
jgi:propanol-preferring alcohol dehydrogenase